MQIPRLKRTLSKRVSAQQSFQSPNKSNLMAAILAAGFSEREILAQLAALGGDHEVLISHVVSECQGVHASGSVGSDSIYFLRRFASALTGKRVLAVRATRKFIELDNEFRQDVKNADMLRDRGEWVHAEAAYYEALCKYPFASGYLVQYGHCLKEQEKWLDAELVYRSAWSLGETTDDLLRHISFVSAKNGRPVNLKILDSIRVFWLQSVADISFLDSPPIRQDVFFLLRLLVGEGWVDMNEVCDFLNKVDTNAALVELLMASPKFAAANRDLLVVALEDL